MLTERQAAEVGFTFPNPAPSTPQMQHVPMQSEGHGTHLPCHLSAPSAATKPRCALHRCNRVAAAECGLCKSCCEGRGQGCSSSKHRSGPPRHRVINTFTPSRPPAALPSLPTASTSTASSFNFQSSTPSESAFAAELPATGRSFREEMPDGWAKEWNERQRKAREKREMEELRRQNELAIARQVVIQLWRSVCALYPFPYGHFRSSTPFRMAPFPQQLVNKISSPIRRLTLHSARA
jgi:hypothetical protein